MFKTGRVTYATNVHHYGHVVRAMSRVFDKVELIRRWEPSPRVLRYARVAHLPARVQKELSRRERWPLPRGVRSSGFGLSVNVDEALSKLGSYSRGTRWRTERSALEVARREGDVLQFVEGLGIQALRKGTFGYGIMERRNLHHAEFEGDLETFAGFPFIPEKDILGDILDEEYERADNIVVYSEAARASFLSRGFASEKVISVPLAFAPRPKRQDKLHRRDSRTFLYVGRGNAFKGIDVAVDAVRRIGGGARLRVAGPFDTRSAEWLRRHPHVDYLGVLSRRELDGEYSRTTALLAPSMESFGLAIIDAAAAGAHVVCLPSSGVGPELPDSCVTVVRLRSPERWAEALSAMVGVQLDDCSGSVRARWTWDGSEACMIEIYRSLEATGGRGE